MADVGEGEVRHCRKYYHIEKQTDGLKITSNVYIPHIYGAMSVRREKPINLKFGI